MTAKTIRRALVLAGTCLLALAGTAHGKQIQQYFYSGESFGAGGSSPGAVAFDGQGQELIVAASGDQEAGIKVSKLHPNGAPAPFTGLPGEPGSFNTGMKYTSAPDLAVAVDESTTVSAGNFYISSLTLGAQIVSGTVFGYAADGTPLSGFPISVPGACGVAVAPDGKLWVASEVQGAYGEFTPTGAMTGRVLSLGTKRAGCHIEFDSDGNFYVAKRNRLAKYDADRHFVADLGAIETLTPMALAFDRAAESLFELSGSGTDRRITQMDTSGEPLTVFGGPDPAHFSYPGFGSATRDLAYDSQGHKAFVLSGNLIDVFSRDASVVTVPSVTTGSVEDLTGTSATLTASLDPDGTDTTSCRFEWGTSLGYGQVAPCAEGDVFAGGSGANEVSAAISGLQKGTTYHYRVVAENANGAIAVARDREFAAADPPILTEPSATRITSEGARIGFAINTNGADSTYRVEVGTDTSYGMSFPVPDAAVSATRPDANKETIEVILTPQPKSVEIAGALEPSTLYHYRVVADNPAGAAESPDRTFRTFALPATGSETCPNAQVRQQTSAAGLLDCRAYELVSAPDSGGYDVRSDLSPDATPLPTSASADDAALYSMRSGTIPGIAGNPTNRGADPYLAERGEDGWSTRYLGIPANNPNATGPFASPLLAFDGPLSTFAFGGDDMCSPCFDDGSTNVPLRLPDGDLVQGMAGSQDAGPAERAGTVRAPLSADGRHFVFGTTAQLEPGANSNGTDATIYERDLSTGVTQVVSTDDSGAPIADGTDIAQLAISEDGSRVVIGDLVQADAAGNRHYHLYMHVGSDPQSIDLTPGTTSGASFAGMSADGSEVYFTTSDPLATAADQDTDTSADLFRADIDGTSMSLARVSVGDGTGDTDACDPAANSYNTDDWNVLPGGPTDCSVLAIGGGGGVAEEGSIHFLSPELLDGASGTAGAPNLYLASPGEAPQLIATLESSASSPLKAGAHVFQGSFGSFANPEGMAIDAANGDIYVLDNLNASFSPGVYVQKFDSEGNPIASFGNNSKIEGSDTPAGGFSQHGGFNPVGLPTQIAVDNAPASPNNGDFYVPDVFNGVIDRFNSSGAYESQVSTSFPVAVAVHPTNGNLYIGNLFGTLEIYDPAGNFVTSFEEVLGFGPKSLAVEPSGAFYVAGGEGTSLYDSTGAFVRSLGSSTAYGVAIDPTDGHVYVDQRERVVEFDPAGNQVGDPFGEGVLSNSVGLAVNAGKLAVSNRGSNNAALFGTPQPPPDRSYDSPLVIESVRAADARKPDLFQVTPTGDNAAFSSSLPFDGFASGRYELFRSDAPSGEIDCVSCSQTLATPAADTFLSSYGSSLTDDGRVFFDTLEPLVLRDSNERKDAYEWSEGTQQLISTGTSESDSAFLSVSSDGKNAFFFTRQKLVKEDQNGNRVRLYTAREDGGFVQAPPIFECAASDECHGPSTEASRPLAASTVAGRPGQFTEEAKPKCRKGKVRRRGRCVKRNQKQRQHKNRASAKRGGAK